LRGLFDPNHGLRTKAEWRELLGELVALLSAFWGIDFRPSSWFTHDDRPGSASSSNSVDIHGVVNPSLRLEACVVVCISINFGEDVSASADLLLFSDGRRVPGPDGLDLMLLVYRDDGWISQGWKADDYGEWKSHDTDERWRAP
jgi:hypothetical protein